MICVVEKSVLTLPVVVEPLIECPHACLDGDYGDVEYQQSAK
jgi:hypothetical protein